MIGWRNLPVQIFWNIILFIYFQLRQEKIQLEQTLEQEQEYQVNKLMRKIDKLESDVLSKQTTLEQVSVCHVFCLNIINMCVCVCMVPMSYLYGNVLCQTEEV